MTWIQNAFFCPLSRFREQDGWYDCESKSGVCGQVIVLLKSQVYSERRLISIKDIGEWLHGSMVFCKSVVSVEVVLALRPHGGSALRSWLQSRAMQLCSQLGQDLFACLVTNAKREGYFVRDDRPLWESLAERVESNQSSEASVARSIIMSRSFRTDPSPYP